MKTDVPDKAEMSQRETCKPEAATRQRLSFIIAGKSAEKAFASQLPQSAAEGWRRGGTEDFLHSSGSLMRTPHN